MRRKSKAPSATATASTGTARARRTIFGLACLCVLAFAAFTGSGAPSVGAAESFPGQGFLPDNRAWEMVSPPEKLGADINGTSSRIRIAADGSAVGFSSLGAFADARGTGLAAEYISERTGEPGANGWSTHSIQPEQATLSQPAIGNFADPRYFGEFSPDLNRGVFFARSSLTEDPDVAGVPNLYLRTDLRSAGQGSYALLSSCPRCAEKGQPLPEPKAAATLFGPMNPQLAGVTPDLSKAVFETRQLLSADTPARPGFCDPEDIFGAFFCPFQAYESDGSGIHYVGRIPASPDISCDEAGGPPCHGAAISRLGQGATRGLSEVITTPDVISDGSSGHTAVFFTFPTNDGVSANYFSFENPPGNVYARIDNTETVQLNASERTDCAGDPGCGGDGVPDPAPASFVPARYVGATPDGSRAFITSEQPLIDDAPEDNSSGEDSKLYMYDLTKPPSDPHNLTLINADAEPADGFNYLGLVGYSDDGRYVYFEADGALRPGEPGGPGIYLWHEGALTYIGSGERIAGAPGFAPPGVEAFGNPGNLTIGDWDKGPRMARVAPDGRHLLFSTHHGEGLLSVRGGVDRECVNCRELYLYSADEDKLQCATCDPSGAPDVDGGAADVVAGVGVGSGTVSRGDVHETSALSDDGRYAFFSSTEALSPEDRNGPCELRHAPSPFTYPNSERSTCTDAYVFDSTTGKISLLSSGESNNSSFFLEASPDGRDALILTRQRLSGWDVDESYDIYDARVDGGLPEPPPPPPTCQGDACQPAPVGLNDPTPASSGFQGPGDAKPRKPHRKKRHGRKGSHHAHKHHDKHKTQRRAAGENGRTGR